jgi:hypothetical protein
VTSTPDPYDRLLGDLPKIAEAVNQFHSPAVQEHAFNALARALRLAPPPDDHNAPNGDRARPVEPGCTLAVMPDIDFRPAGQQSLIDLAAEKKPRNQNQQNLLAIYYLEHVLGLQDITTEHIRAAYRECHWREPSSFLRSLQNTASHTSLISTRHMKDIRTTPAGTHTVENQMPRNPAAKTPAKRPATADQP